MKGRSLTMRSIFRCMMEEGYYPIYEKSHIVFGIDDNLCVVEYEEGILSIRLFFSIDEDDFEFFLEAANGTMLQAYMVKPTVLDDMQNLMFSCEIMCDTVREFRKFFPRGIEMLKEAIRIHRKEMKKILYSNSFLTKRVPATEDIASVAGTEKSRKVLS